MRTILVLAALILATLAASGVAIARAADHSHRVNVAAVGDDSTCKIGCWA